MIKIFWVDCETTGLDPEVNEIIQISGIIEKSEEQSLTNFNLNLAPTRWDNIEQAAIDTHGISIDTMEQYPPASNAYITLLALMDNAVNKFDKEDKMYVGGQNVAFDIAFLKQLFIDNGNPYLFSYIHPGFLELSSLLSMYDIQQGKKTFVNHKLGTICEGLGIELTEAHDAFADIKATRECFIELWGRIAK